MHTLHVGESACRQLAALIRARTSRRRVRKRTLTQTNHGQYPVRQVTPRYKTRRSLAARALDTFVFSACSAARSIARAVLSFRSVELSPGGGQAIGTIVSMSLNSSRSVLKGRNSTFQHLCPRVAGAVDSMSHAHYAFACGELSLDPIGGVWRSLVLRGSCRARVSAHHHVVVP